MRKIVFILFCLFSSQLSCGETRIEPPAPSSLTIRGLVTDESHQPLASIQIHVDTAGMTKIESGYIPFYSIGDSTYSDKQGEYIREYEVSYDNMLLSEWPSEITVVAVDTAGVYETQAQQVSVQIEQPFLPQFNTTFGIATADFVLRKAAKESVGNVHDDPAAPQKFIHNGQIYILHYCRTYTIIGMEVK